MSMKGLIVCAVVLFAACGDNIPAQDSSVSDGGAGGGAVARESLVQDQFSPADSYFSFEESCDPATGCNASNYVPGGDSNHYWGIAVTDELISAPPQGAGRILTYDANSQTGLLIPTCDLQLTENVALPAPFAARFPSWFGTRKGYPPLSQRTTQAWSGYVMRMRVPNGSGGTCRWTSGNMDIVPNDFFLITQSGPDPDTYVMMKAISRGVPVYAYMSFRGIFQ